MSTSAQSEWEKIQQKSVRQKGEEDMFDAIFKPDTQTEKQEEMHEKMNSGQRILTMLYNRWKDLIKSK